MKAAAPNMQDYEAAFGNDSLEVPEFFNFGFDVVDRWAEDRTKLALLSVGPSGETVTDASTGNGPVDAVCKAIDRVIGCSCKLVDFNVQSVSEGLDAMATVTIRIENSGSTFSGRGASTDVIVASAMAYLSGVNRMLAADEEANLPAVGTTPD